MKFVLPESGKLLAPAKVNLHLQVTGILPDGRHLLDTSFAFVDCYDELDIRPCDCIQVTCSDAALSGENNLVHQVLKALQEKAGVRQGLAVHVNKQLPAQAGLGGGSSDAAVALLAANSLWDLHWDTQTLIELVTPLGADIPCFLFGQASLATGVGECLQVFPEALPQAYVCLVRPPSGLSTGAVFQHYDATHQFLLTGENDGATVRPASQGRLQIGVNDLEASAVALLQDVGQVLQRMRASCELAWMSGSGSTCIGLLSSKQAAQALSASLQRDGWASWTHVGRLLRVHPAFE